MEIHDSLTDFFFSYSSYFAVYGREWRHVNIGTIGDAFRIMTCTEYGGKDKRDTEGFWERIILQFLTPIRKRNSQ